MSHPPTSAILESMMEDLGLGRVQELPMEDRPKNHDEALGGFRGAFRGAFRGSGRGRGRDQAWGRAASESVRAVNAQIADGVADAWKDAIASNVFNDDDAAEVQGLDTLGGGQLHRMRVASDNIGSGSSQSRFQREVSQAHRNPVQASRPLILGKNDSPVPVGPIRKFPPGYARNPNDNNPGQAVQQGSSAGGLNGGPQHQQQPQQRAQPEVQPHKSTPPGKLSVQEQRQSAPPSSLPTNVQAVQTATPVNTKVSIPEPDAASIVIQEGIKITVRRMDEFYEGRVYICKENSPTTASIIIVVHNNEMDDMKYPLAQWKEYLHMDRCVVACFEPQPGYNRGHALEFASVGAMARFVEKYKLFRDNRDKQTSLDLPTKPMEQPALPISEKATVAHVASQKSNSPQQSKFDAAKPPIEASQVVDTSIKHGSTPFADATEKTAKPKSRDPTSVLQAAWQKGQALSYKEQKSQTDPSKSAQNGSSQKENQQSVRTVAASDDKEGGTSEAAEGKKPAATPAQAPAVQPAPNEAKQLAQELPTKEAPMVQDTHLSAPGVDDQSNDDEEYTLREYLHQLRDRVTDHLKAEGKQSSVTADNLFREVVEAFVMNTSEYYNELDDEGKKGVVQAYYDLAMKPKRARRRSYSPEQLLDMRDSAVAPSESDMRFKPPSPQTAPVSPALDKSPLSASAAAFVPKPAEGAPSHPESSNLAEQIQKVAANVEWLMASQPAPKSANPPVTEKTANPAEQTDQAAEKTEKPLEKTEKSSEKTEQPSDKTEKSSEKVHKDIGLNSSRWANPSIPAVASAGKFTGPLAGQNDPYSPSPAQTDGTDKTSRDRSLIPGASSSADVPDPFAFLKYSGAARDLVGLNFGGPISGYTADLVGLDFNYKETPTGVLKVETKTEKKDESNFVLPTSVSSIGEIELSLRKMRLS